MEVEALGGSLLFIIVAQECQHLGMIGNILAETVEDREKPYALAVVVMEKFRERPATIAMVQDMSNAKHAMAPDR